MVDVATVRSFALGRVFADNAGPVNAMDFTRDGRWLVTSSDDESLHLYDIESGTSKKKVASKKYGVKLVRCTHQSSSILVASKNTWDESIRYLSLHDNRYLRYFKGHRAEVTSMELSPVNDSFLSAAKDSTARLWDLRTSVCQGMLKGVEGRPQVAYDPEGVIFGVSGAEGGSGVVRLYDVRSYEQGPFATFTVPAESQGTNALGGAADSDAASAAAAAAASGPVYTHMKFSPDGKHIALGTNTATVHLLDSFNGEMVQSYSSRINDAKSLLEPSFSPDGKFILSGSEDGTIRVWDTLSGEEVCVWKGHPQRCGVVRWNPTKMMVASACTKVGFWLPKESKTE